MTTIPPKVPIVLSLLGLAGFAAVSYLAFIFPRTISAWKDHDQSLPAAKQLAVHVSTLCVQFGWILLPMFLLAFIGCGIWASILMRGIGRKNRGSDGSTPA